ncbi:glycosyltransferase family 61 protein, partial [Pelagibacteraceae bacterium]|nr:glycosyltransferase family 61 protein [Pelagibacteraceae bacterium]
MIENISLSDLEKNKDLNKSFLTVKLENINQSCTYYQGNFYLDSFNYYPITEDYKSFDELFIRLNKNSIEHYHSDTFYKKFKDKLNNIKVFKNCCVIGSNPGNNYFSNLIHFLPRIFFENESQIKIAIHRNLSNKFKSFIEHLFSLKNVQLTYTYLDDDFYKFENSKIPQFLNTLTSISLLNSIKDIVPKKKSEFDKIYVRREDTNYRTILNEADLIDKLKKNGFKVISTSQYEILDQINFFANAKIVLSAYGSGLANIVFCNPGTKVYEISPNFNNINDQSLSKRYQILCKLCNLNYHRFAADSVDVKKHDLSTSKYINKKILI